MHEHGIIVGHVVSNTTFARKCDEAGVDIIVAEGMEAGGHNGREETSTLCLIPQVRAVTNKLLLAAGGISTRASYHAALALGADGVQMGTRFALSAESSAHPDFKAYCRNLSEGQTRLMLKQLSPTRLAKNPFSDRVAEAEAKGINLEDLKILQGKGRAKKGIFEGDLVEGMLEIGQTAGSIKHEETVATIFADLVS
ncbi:MAG: Nitronate monooxygenase [Bacteroidetes bacterium ADurb.Bin416]|nr:MAG: Nitronate monooxygenase [Bacteroidetes bacterium ADurb.Bin416]